jgi:hypothetical protein
LNYFLGNIDRVTPTKKPTKQANKMSFPSSSTNQQSWSIRPTVQCDNPSCRSWNDEPTPGTKCFKCLSILPTWVGYLNNNSGSDGVILEESNYQPPPPLERTAGQERESWYADEVNEPLERSMTINMDDKPLKLTRTDGDAAQEEEEEHITNAEQVVRDMISIFKLDREGALRKFDEIIKNVVVTHS